MPRNELEAALEDFLSQDPPTTTDEMLRVLERFNAPWTRGVEAIRAIGHNERSKGIPDYITTVRDPIEDPLPHLDRIPFLYRLHSLRQLSTVMATTHFGATHTRFSHSVGTVLAAQVIIKRLREERFDDPAELVDNGLSALENPVVRTACLAFCALHDAFHGPFGHSLDIMKDVFGAKPNEKLDNKYLAEGLHAALSGRADDPIGLQLRAAAELWVGAEHAEELLRLVLLLLNKARLLAERPELYFLRQIADSEIDADRVDYVTRDGLYLEHRDFRSDYSEALATVRVVAWTPPVAGSAPRSCLAFANVASDAIARLLSRRREYYTCYYETAEKLVVDDMICHGLVNVLESKDVEDRPSSAAKAATVAELKRNIMLLTDESFIPALLELKAAPASYDLLFRYQQRRFFQVIQTIDLRLEEVLRIRSAATRWLRGVDEFLKQQAERAGVGVTAYRLVTRENEEQAKSVFAAHFEGSVEGALAASKQALEDEHLEADVLRARLETLRRESELKILAFGFQVWSHGVFRHRQKFERNVWERLTSDRRRHDDLAILAEREFGDAVLRTRFDQFPPIHVTTPSHFAMLEYRDVLLHRKESAYPVDGILLYDIEHLQDIREVPIKPSAKEDRPSYPLVLSAPREIIEIFGADVISSAFVGELRALEWLVLHYSEP